MEGTQLLAGGRAYEHHRGFPTHGLPSAGATQSRLENNLRSVSMENVCFISSFKHACPRGRGKHCISSLQGWPGMAGRMCVGPDNGNHLNH